MDLRKADKIFIDREIEIDYLINENLYFGDYIVVQEICYLKLRYPLPFPQFLSFESCFAHVIKCDKKKSIEECVKDYGLPNPFEYYQYFNEDLTKELEVYCPNPEKQSFYFYKKVFEDNKEIPLLNTCMSRLVEYKKFGHDYEEHEIEELNEIISKDMALEFIRNKGRIKPHKVISKKKIISYEGFEQIPKSDLVGLIEHMAYIEWSLVDIFLAYKYKIIMDDDLECLDDEKIIENIKDIVDYNRCYFGVDYPAFYNWCWQLIKSLIYEVIPNKLLICAYCGELMKYRKNKKYCSIDVDGQDCYSKAKSDRQNKRRKLRHIDNK